MIIDFHTHPTLLRELFLENVSKVRRERKLEEIRTYGGWDAKPLTLEETIAEMDRAGVEKSVIVQTPFYEETNEFVASVVERYPDRFIGFALVDPRKGETAVQDLERAVKELGLRGIGELELWALQLYPNDKTLYPLYAKAQELGIPVCFHVGVAYEKMKYNNPLYIDDVAVDFPRLKIVIGGLGYPWVDIAISIAYMKPNVYLDTHYWSQPDMLRYLLRHRIPIDFIEKKIPDKILYGSDFPFVRPSDSIPIIKNLPVGDELKNKILGENAAKVLGLK